MHPYGKKPWWNDETKEPTKVRERVPQIEVRQVDACKIYLPDIVG